VANQANGDSTEMGDVGVLPVRGRGRERRPRQGGQIETISAGREKDEDLILTEECTGRSHTGEADSTLSDKREGWDKEAAAKTSS
jgi:hypothetical protein